MKNIWRPNLCKAYRAFEEAKALEDRALSELRYAIVAYGHRSPMVGTLETLHQITLKTRRAAFDAWREKDDAEMVKLKEDIQALL